MEKILIRILEHLLIHSTPEIKNALCNGLNDLALKAKKTPNPIDDMLVKFLQMIVGCK